MIRKDLQALAGEQAALRRIATLVVRRAAPEEVFAAAVEEVERLLPADYACMGRYEPDNTVTYVAASSMASGALPQGGSRHGLGGNDVSTLVLETGNPARVDRPADASGEAPFGESGVRSMVGTPIVVEGRLWGVMIAISTREEPPMPDDTEERLSSLTELLATAVANADSRAGVARLAEEQRALRRVAALVAQRGAAPEEVFSAATEEIGRLLTVDSVGMGQYEPDGTLTVVARWGSAVDFVHDGSPWSAGGKNIGTLVFESGRPVRVDSYADASRPAGVAARETGVRSSVGTPIIVEGRLWGVIGARSSREQPLPPDTEARLASFTELLATAIGNAENAAGLARLTAEHAGLRRVAMLVARGSAPEEVFGGVVEEVGQLLGVAYAGLGRYESAGTLTFVSAWSQTGEDPYPPVGSQWRLGGKNVATLVFETARPARLDRYANATGPVGVTAREAGFGSSVGTPIIVEGRLWGVVIAGSTLERPMPVGTEARLASFTELVATAIANAESRAELTASRARIVSAADESRRRIQRDLHDGAQQRLAHAMLVLKLTLRALNNADPDAGELLAEALRHAEQANFELRELAHGILPSALTRGGLRAGVQALVSRLSLPVSVDLPDERLPSGVEAAAYFVVSEALTNVVKHARAASATVTARAEHGELRVEICDDGSGGADPARVSGLVGLNDRVEALGGTLEVTHPSGDGTTLLIEIPVG